MLAFAGGAYAQTDSMSKSSSSDSMSSSSQMSKSDMAKMNKCKAMSHDAMMKDKGCAAMMKAHPEMMSGDDSMAKPQ
ncbi:MAG: hypothetical protein ACR2FH_00805 [Caulobacteraceae bacterium]